MNSKHVFIGPSIGTLKYTAFADKGFTVHPPVQRGDVEKITKDEKPDLIVLIDGYFENCLAVGHAEIRRALEAGCKVIGLSSMGAIRAFEMRNLGMLGYGSVYARFLQSEDFQDDEVSLLHAPFHPFSPLTEPLVHIREAMQNLHELDAISATSRDMVISDLKGIWFGVRTINRWRASISEHCDRLALLQLDEIMKEPERFRIKNHDVQRFLETEAWK